LTLAVDLHRPGSPSGPGAIPQTTPPTGDTDGRRQNQLHPKTHYQIVNGQLNRKGLAWNIHKGTSSLDTDLDECSPTQWSDLEDDAATSQSAFDTTAGVIWGTDYSTLPSEAQEGMRQIVNAGLP
jgi:hypothetical protein